MDSKGRSQNVLKYCIFRIVCLLPSFFLSFLISCLLPSYRDNFRNFQRIIFLVYCCFFLNVFSIFISLIHVYLCLGVYQDAGIGTSIDSFYEYLLKVNLQFPLCVFWVQWELLKIVVIAGDGFEIRFPLYHKRDILIARATSFFFFHRKVPMYCKNIPEEYKVNT